MENTATPLTINLNHILEGACGDWLYQQWFLNRLSDAAAGGLHGAGKA